jgi:hypothetical protein
VAEWGCGTGCLTGALVDVKTGKSSFLPLLVGSGSTDSSINDQDQKFDYHIDSRLLLAKESLGVDTPYRFAEHFYVIEAGALTALDVTIAAENVRPPISSPSPEPPSSVSPATVSAAPAVSSVLSTASDSARSSTDQITPPAITTSSKPREAAVNPIMMLLLVVAVFYFLPSLIASGKGRFLATFVANLAFGWTFVGWIIILIWALTPSSRAPR